MTGSAKEKKAGDVMETARRRAAGWVLLMLGVGAGLDASAQTPSKYPWDEYDKRVESAKQAAALKSDLFGDQVNLANGSLSFTATDAAIPGNNALPVSLSRSYSVQNRYGGPTSPPVTDFMLADWDVDMPSISGSFASNWESRVPGNPGRRCSAPAHQASPPSPVWDINVWDFWQGNTLNVPGAGGELLQVRPGAYLPSTGGPYYWMTTGQTYVSCLPTIKNTTGEGFLAITPDGTKYWFDWMAQYREPNLSSANGGSNIARRKNVLYATKVQDRFGNTVDYTYTNAWNAPARLTGIVSSDGRQLIIAYNAQGHISTVTQGTRTWMYQYVALGSRRSLSAVVQPDGTQWTIGFSSFTSAELYYPTGHPAEPTRDCFVRFGPPIGPTTVTGTVQHPSGALGTFTLGWLTHGRSNVPVACQNFDIGGEYGTNTSDDTNQWAISYEAYSLTKKLITGPGLSASEWNYSYTPNISHQFYPGGDMLTPCPMGTSCGAPICTSDACAGRAETLVLGPNGERTKYFHGNSYRYNEGKLLRVERGSTTTPLMDVQVSTFDLSMAPQVYPERFGYSLRENFDGFTSEYHRPQLSTTTTRDGVDFKYQVDLFDALARPKAVKRFSSIAGSQVKTELTDYHDSQSLWVLGQTQRLVVNGQEVAESTFDALARPWVSESYGRIMQTLTYNADGTVATVKDGNNNVTAASNWKRGVPQAIQHPPTPEAPAGAMESAVVNDNGWITSVTDENGYTTGYGYDAMGRLASIVYPTGDTTAWNTTTLSFAPSSTPVYGLPAGHWRQVIQTGNNRKVVMMDALWRPIVTETYDAGDLNGTISQVVNRYDENGRVSFISYPQRNLDPTVYNTWGNPSLAPNAAGTHTFYDALGRVTSSSQDSELGLLTTLTEYLPGFQTRVTNPRGFQTLIQYQAFDQPSHDYPTGITQFAGADTSATEIHRDVFGKPVRIRKRNNSGSLFVDRHYVYHANQLLCKVVEPETGATVMGYDAAGNLTKSASGLGSFFLDIAYCNHAEAWASGLAVDRSYDARNRITSLSFPDGLGNTTHTYTPDGLPANITANNGGSNIVTTEYTYNRRRLLTQERMLWGSIDWPLTYGYNANGHLQNQVLPGSLIVGYAPNALGQPTQAGTYATGVTYYPNGAIKQFTYGNGVVHNLIQNARQLPERSYDCAIAGTGCASTNKRLDLSYAYDAAGNVSGITDNRNGRQTRSMAYDGLDRLNQTISPMFGTASYSYNALDNLTSVGVTGGTSSRTHTYTYNAANQVTNIKNTAGATEVALEYDVQGNVAIRSGLGVTNDYTFDYGNRLRSVAGKASYVYDGLGRRVRDFTTASKYSLYSQGGQLVYASDNRQSLATQYIYLGGSLVAFRERPTGSSTATVKYQHTDALGTPTAVTDATNTIIETYEYEPYGQLVNSTLKDGPGYTGHVQDAATGLTYMQQRYYDPQVGMFLSVDPVAVDTSKTYNFNRFAYAANNPYRFKDPDGRDCISADGRTTCKIAGPNGKGLPTVSFPTPKGWPAVMSRANNPIAFHSYRKSARIGGKSAASVRASVVRDPTPNDQDRPASPTGTPNDATPSTGLRGWGASAVNNDVLSFSATDQKGNVWVINVTQESHTLSPGFVIRGVVGNELVSAGEGLALKQAIPLFSDKGINDAWLDQNKQNIDEAR
jgi:RHS repeat-associated core domain